MTASVVQQAHADNAASVTLGSAVTAGNSLILGVACYSTAGASMSSSSPTCGGSAVAGAVKLAEAQTSGATAVYAALWLLPSLPGGGTTAGVTFAGDTGPSECWAAEVAGLGGAPVPGPAAAASGTGTAASSGATAALPRDGFAVGLTSATGAGWTAPGSPWTAAAIDSGYVTAGYQEAASGAVSFAASAGSSADWAAVAATVYGSFPASPLDLRAEMEIGGTWMDESVLVYQRDGTTAPVSISRGRPDESATCNPARIGFELNNRDGRFSPLNPAGPYYGQFRRNTPVRFSVPAASNYMRLESDTTSYATCPDAAALEITGDLDVRVDMRPSDWQLAALCSKSDPSGAHAWLLDRLATGELEFFWWDASAVQYSVTSTLPPPQHGRIAIRATLAVATGTVTFWTAPDISGTWTQLGAAASGTGGAATSVDAATVPVRVGDESAASYGAYYHFELRDGIGGTVAASADFTAQAAGATSWTDAQGNAWSLTGTAEISGRDYRAHGELASLPARWDVTGADMAVKATASGPLRRLSQGSQPPVMSPMKRAALTQSGALFPVAYWPMEDGTAATSLGSATGGTLMSFDVNPAPKLASDSSFACSAPLMTLNGSRLYGAVPPYSGGTAIVVRFLAKLGALPASNAVLLRFGATGTVATVSLRVYSAGGLGISGWRSDGTNVFDTGAVSFGTTSGQAWWYSLEATPVSGGMQYALVTLAPGAAAAQATSVTVTGGVHGNVTNIQVNTGGFFTDTVFGHLSAQSAWASLFSLSQPLNAWDGEAAAARYARLCGENGYPVRIVGAPLASAAMGQQPADSLSNLLQACEDADRGQAFEPRTCLGLGYRTLASMLNQAAAVTLDYAASEPGGVDGNPSDSGLDPTYDDQLLRNDWTVTRTAVTGSGAAATARLDDGSAMSVSEVGDYADSKSVNVAADDQLGDIAGWMVHVGSVDEARWPVIPVNLARAAASGLYHDALDLDVGDYARVASLPTAVVADPARQLALGFRETLGGFHHAVEVNAVPESPYEVAVFDDDVYGRADTDGSSLAAAATATATTLSVATTAGYPPWTTDSADCPFDIGVAGERMTVTAVTGSSSPQSFTVTRSVNGVVKAQSSGADVRLWFPPAYSLI